MKNEIIERLGNEFWTELDEMLDDIRDLGLSVEEANDEYVVASNEDDAVIIYLGHANRTMWIEKVREAA